MRTLSRLRRTLRNRRIKAGLRPDSVVDAFNEKERKEEVAGGLLTQLHPTKGYRRNYVSFGMQGALAALVASIPVPKHERKQPKQYRAYNRTRESARNLRNA